jgi:hypothetical protein
MDRDAIFQLARLYGSPSHESSGNVMMRCPLGPRHKSGVDNNPSFSVKIAADEPSVSRCFACGFAGPVRRAFEEAHELTGLFAEALAHIQETDKGGLEGALAGLRRCRSVHVFETGAGGPTQTVDGIERYVARAMRYVPHYLIARGILAADVQKWRLGFDIETMRAVFPIWDEHGVLVGTDRRTVVEETATNPKYHAWPPGFRKKEYFYGENFIDATRERVYLVEGPMDTIFAARLLPNVLGLLGAHTGIGVARLAKLRRWAKRITFIFDGDEPGHNAVEGYIDEWGKDHPGLRDSLRREFVCDVVTLPPREDPASLIVKNQAAFMEAVSRTRYLGFVA